MAAGLALAYLWRIGWLIGHTIPGFIDWRRARRAHRSRAQISRAVVGHCPIRRPTAICIYGLVVTASAIRWVTRRYRHVRLVRSAAFRLGEALGSTRRVLIGTVPTGSPIALFSSDRQHRSIWFYGLYEPDVTAVLRGYLDPGATFFDVGANVGYFSLLARDLGATVHAFEPNPEVLSLLMRSRAMRPDRLTIVPKACGLRPERRALTIRAESNTGMSTLMAAPGRSFGVDVTPIDEYATAAHTLPTVMKIDVEGFELEVLQGAGRVLRDGRPHVIVETTASSSPRPHDGSRLLRTNDHGRWCASVR